MNSILNDVKLFLGIPEEFDSFDSNLITCINSVFVVLSQIGVGSDVPFKIQNGNTTWDEFSQDCEVIEMVKTYVPEKVALMFDPPSSSYASDALKSVLAEQEWRLNIACDKGE